MDLFLNGEDVTVPVIDIDECKLSALIFYFPYWPKALELKIGW